MSMTLQIESQFFMPLREEQKNCINPLKLSAFFYRSYIFSHFLYKSAFDGLSSIYELFIINYLCFPIFRWCFLPFVTLFGTLSALESFQSYMDRGRKLILLILRGKVLTDVFTEYFTY